MVTRKGGPSVSRLQELSGKEVHVVARSEQMESLDTLNQGLQKDGLAPVKVIEAKPYMADENLLEMLNAGMISAAVVPDAFARLWARVFKNLIVHESIPLSLARDAAWAVRKGNLNS